MTSRTQTHPPCAFVVDDEVAFQLSLQALLGIWGIPVRAFSSAEEFLSAYRGDWTGCLIVDLRMPGMGGLELLRQLRKRDCSLATLLMTGHGEHELLQQAIELGAAAVLEKPYRAEELKDFLERHCPAFFTRR
ncbi:MAG: response regulator transcription factor [Aureliella sp.]